MFAGTTRLAGGSSDDFAPQENRDAVKNGGEAEVGVSGAVGNGSHHGEDAAGNGDQVAW